MAKSSPIVTVLGYRAQVAITCDIDGDSVPDTATLNVELDGKKQPLSARIEKIEWGPSGDRYVGPEGDTRIALKAVRIVPTKRQAVCVFTDATPAKVNMGSVAILGKNYCLALDVDFTCSGEGEYGCRNAADAIQHAIGMMMPVGPDDVP